MHSVAGLALRNPRTAAWRRYGPATAAWARAPRSAALEPLLAAVSLRKSKKKGVHSPLALTLSLTLILTLTPGLGKCVMEYTMRLFALRCAGKNINCNVVVPGVTTTDAWGKLAATRGMDKVPPTPHLAHPAHSAHSAHPAHPAHPAHSAHPAPRTAHPYRRLPSTHPHPHTSPPIPHPTLLPLTLKDEMIAGIAGRISPMGAMSPKQLGDACAFLCSPAGRIITGVSLPVDGGVHLKA